MTARDDSMPHNPDAERVVLGAMMLSGDMLEQVTERLTSESFYRPEHSMLFAQIIAAWAGGEPTDPIGLAGRLSRVGELHRIQGGAAYLHTIVNSVPTAAQAGYFADLVAETAHQRTLLEQSVRLGQAAQVPDAGRRAELVAAVRERLDGARIRTEPRAQPLDWSTFMLREPGPVDFLAGRLMVHGQQIALVGDGKAGKSLFALEWAWRISAGLPFLEDGERAPLRVLYVDQENPEDDIQERLVSLGATSDTLRNLIYLSFPAFRPLNTAAGAADLLATVDQHDPAVIFFDTISRMVKGKENEADPWLDLYRLALMPLKARKKSSIRLDHFGKDRDRGARGNSAKYQDVDAVWELVPTERGSDLLDLKRTHTRNGKGAGELFLRRHGVQDGDRWKPSGTWHSLADESDRPLTKPDPATHRTPAQVKLLEALSAQDGVPVDWRHLVDSIAKKYGHGLRRETVSRELNELAEQGLVDSTAQAGKATLWLIAKTDPGKEGL